MRRPERVRNDNPPEICIRTEVAVRVLWEPTLSQEAGKADVRREVAGEGTAGFHRERSPGIRRELRRDNVGKGRLPAGAGSNLHGPANEGRPKEAGGIWSGAWARRSDDGRVTPPQAADQAAPARVALKPGEGALGTWRFQGGPGH